MYHFGLGLIGIGSYCFARSLRKIKLRRQFLDTPTSRIASTALGESVEIHGQVIFNGQTIKSPLTGKDCVAFHWCIEGKYLFAEDAGWVPLYQFYSVPYFYITDESGEIAAVDLSSSRFQETLYDSDTIFKKKSPKIPARALQLLKLHKLMVEKGWWRPRKYRIREKLIKPDEKFYIHGTADLVPALEIPRVKNPRIKFDRGNRDLIEKAKLAFRSLRGDLETIKTYDLDKNGRLDQEENVRLYEDIEKEILKEYGVSSRKELLKKAKFLFVGSKHKGLFFSENTVFISSQSESKLAASLGCMSLRDFFLGPTLIVLGIAVLWYSIALTWEAYLFKTRGY